MVKATTCLMDGEEITIENALLSRSEAKARKQRPPVFTCVECGELIDPHNEGDGSPAHIEHRVKNHLCSLSVAGKNRRQTQSAIRPSSWITTTELSQLTAGGDSYIRSKGGKIKGLALNPHLNPDAPNIVIVGKGPNKETRAKLYLASNISVPVYVKRGTNAWELIGSYRAIEYKTDAGTIRKHHSTRPIDEVAGILFLERTDEATVDIRGGGFADPKTRKEVETAAISFVTAHYQSQGYTVESHESQNLGYDLLAFRADSVLKLEVKGTDGVSPRFFLTRNERKCAAETTNWRLVIVTNARKVPSMDVLTIDEVELTYNFDPLAWECTLNP